MWEPVAFYAPDCWYGMGSSTSRWAVNAIHEIAHWQVFFSICQDCDRAMCRHFFARHCEMICRERYLKLWLSLVQDLVNLDRKSLTRPHGAVLCEPTIFHPICCCSYISINLFSKASVWVANAVLAISDGLAEKYCVTIHDQTQVIANVNYVALCHIPDIYLSVKLAIEQISWRFMHCLALHRDSVLSVLYA